LRTSPGTEYKGLMAKTGQARLEELLYQPESLTDDDITELRSLVKIVQHVPYSQSAALLRMAIENIDSIRRFDKASGELVTTTNRLTTQILWLTWTMLGVGLLGALASGWSNLAWWVKHGLRFH